MKYRRRVRLPHLSRLCYVLFPYSIQRAAQTSHANTLSAMPYLCVRLLWIAQLSTMYVCFVSHSSVGPLAVIFVWQSSKPGTCLCCHIRNSVYIPVNVLSRICVYGQLCNAFSVLSPLERVKKSLVLPRSEKLKCRRLLPLFPTHPCLSPTVRLDAPTSQHHYCR